MAVFDGPLGSFAQKIADAYEGADALEGARRIDELWAVLDEVDALAEARMRLLLGRFPAPDRAEAPEWLAKKLWGLASVETQDRAASLIRALLAVVPAAGEPELTLVSSTVIEVDWGPLTWHVYPSRLPWPACCVRVYLPGEDPAYPFRLRARTYHIAHPAIEASVAALREDDHVERQEAGPQQVP